MLWQKIAELNGGYQTELYSRLIWIVVLVSILLTINLLFVSDIIYFSDPTFYFITFQQGFFTIWERIALFPIKTKYPDKSLKIYGWTVFYTLLTLALFYQLIVFHFYELFKFFMN